MTNSATISIGISPAALKISGPLPANSKTTVCAGPFTVNTLDGATTPNVTAAIAPITVNLTQTGYPTGFTSAGIFYSESSCSNNITTLTFNTGVSAQSFYFSGQYPATSLTLTATDSAAVLTAGATTWTILAAKAWIGTAGSIVDSLGDLLWFRSGVKPVAARMDAPSSARHLHFDATKTYLYVVDEISQRVLKYDYVNRKYIGWIGGFSNPNNAAAFISGSTRTNYPSVPSPAQCISTTSGQTTPGWCLGGQSYASTNSTGGVMYNPRRVADDGTYIYVTQASSNTVLRYNAESGAYAGWIGGVASTPTAAATGGPASCTSTSSGQTPGWCIGGTNAANASGTGSWGFGSGSMVTSNAIVTDGTYIYVSNSGAILRFLSSTGAFSGWIGKAYTTAPTGGAAGCTSLSSATTTPGWCIGGTYQAYTPRTQAGTGNLAGGVNNPTDLFIKNGLLYVVHTDNSGTITTYNLSTGAFVQVLPGLSYNWLGPWAMTEDTVTGNFIVADSSRVIAIDSTGLLQGWMGKVNNNGGLSSALSNTNDCSSLSVNANTPGWCLGGTAKAGLDEQAFEEAVAIENDGNGNILVGQYRNPSIKIFNMATGAYGGSLVYSSTAPNAWSNNATAEAEYYGFGDGDFYQPSGAYSDGTYLYVADAINGRIKKIQLASGATIGWIGAVTTTPTGGPSPSCLTTNPMSTTTSWCLGALPNPWAVINFITNVHLLQGSLNNPQGVTGDGTYLYVVDRGTHRIHKFNAATGAFVGWIGNITTSPTGGDAGCNGAAPGTFTPGWCTGGYSAAGSGNGMLTSPAGIAYVAATGYLYVVDTGNHRVSAYDASTGAFKGWIGRTNTAPSSGCTTATNGTYVVSTSGWCLGGTSQAGLSGGDRGGGFAFWGGNGGGGISSDGTYLYISNFYNQRIDKYSLSGVLQGATNSRWDVYTNTWTNVPANIAAIAGNYSMGTWADSTYLYGLDYYSTGAGSEGPMVWKMNLATGTIIGWQGAILPGNSPVGGDSGCAGASTFTPGWCQGGIPMQGFKMGQFSSAFYLTGDSKYIYVTDQNTHRVTRLPK